MSEPRIPPTPLHHIAAVARLTGLSTDVIRTWERRYGLIRPQRDASGIRVYGDAEILRLRLARRATERGHPIRKVATLTNDEIAALIEAGERREPAAGISDETDVGAAVIATAVDALRHGDGARVRRAIIPAVMLMEPRELVLNVLAPLMRAIGTLWHDGEIGVWQEHLISEIVSSTTGILTRITGDGAPSRVRLLFATPPQELHEFGIAFGAMLAAARGLRAVNLGPNVPARELVRAATELDATCIVVGITRTEIDRAEAAAFLAEVDAALPRGVAVWIGGPLSEELAARLGRPRLRAIPTLEALAQALDAAAVATAK